MQALLLGLVLAATVLAIYYPVHWQPFANYDDPDYVTENIHVKEGLHWQTVKWSLTTRDAAKAAPAAMSSLAIPLLPSGGSLDRVGQSRGFHSDRF